MVKEIKKVYQIRDVSDDEVYYEVGVFTSLEEAKEQLVNDNISNLKNTVDGDSNPDYAKYEIHEIELNKVSNGYYRVFNISFDSKFNEDKDESEWEVIF